LAIARIPNVQKRKSGASPLEGGSMTIGAVFVKRSRLLDVIRPS
jgi:hypothetical protein